MNLAPQMHEHANQPLSQSQPLPGVMKLGQAASLSCFVLLICEVGGDGSYRRAVVKMK